MATNSKMKQMTEDGSKRKKEIKVISKKVADVEKKKLIGATLEATI